MTDRSVASTPSGSKCDKRLARIPESGMFKLSVGQIFRPTGKTRDSHPATTGNGDRSRRPATTGSTTEFVKDAGCSTAFRDTIRRFEQYASVRSAYTATELKVRSNLGPGTYDSPTSLRYLDPAFIILR